MSNYYGYREVKVMIAHKLMKMDGWKVYGYSPDQSDSMTDYYCPATWEGIAEKNGYILCVDVYGASKGEDIKQYNYSNFSYDKNILNKIEKLKMFTPDRGASSQEVETAKAKIEILQKKAEKSTENKEKYTIIGHIPAHMAHPPKCNWHIEKDGMIIAKGSGLLKYNEIRNYFTYDSYIKDIEDFKTQSKDEYIKKYTDDLIYHNYYSENEKAQQAAESHYTDMININKLIDQFNSFINKIDTTCGCLCGNGDIDQYKKVTITEYRTEIKVIEVENGSIAEGQLFILKTNFNYGHCKGQIFKIHETEYNGKKYYHAYKLNRKHTKECTGQADVSNHWSTFNEKFLKWIEKGTISWCELREVKTPYEVEKVVKKTVKAENKKPETELKNKIDETENKSVNNIEYEIETSEHTKTHEPLWLVKIKNNLSKEQFTELKHNFAILKGYYSTFTHSFVFKYDPTDKLKIA
jgi:hypothetical protein